MAAPTIALGVSQASTALPYQSNTLYLKIGETRGVELGSFDWVQSLGDTREYVLEANGGGDPNASLASSTVYDRFVMFSDPYQGVYGHARPGTLDALDLFGYGYGDPSSNGFDSYVVRVGDSGKPDLVVTGMATTAYNQTYPRVIGGSPTAVFTTGSVGASDTFTTTTGHRVFAFDAGSDTWYVVYYDTVDSAWKIATSGVNPSVAWANNATLTLTSKETLATASDTYGDHLIPAVADANVAHSPASWNDPNASPADELIVVGWNSSTTGDGTPWKKATVEWFPDLTHTETAALVASFGASGIQEMIRYTADPRKSGVIADLFGTTPSDTAASDYQGGCIHLLLPAGTYRWGCRVTNGSDKLSTTEYATFTVNAETETAATVHNADAADYTSIQAAIAAGELLITPLAGHAETTSANIAITANNTRIIGPDTGTAPAMTRSGSRRFDILASGCTVINLDMVANTVVGATAFRMAATAGATCKNNAVVACRATGTSRYLNFGLFFNSSNGHANRCEFNVFMNNSSPESTSYQITTGNSPHPIYCCSRVGNDFGESTTESVDRTTGMQTNCVYAYQRMEDPSKSTFRHSYGRDHWMFRNHFIGGARLGETGNNFHKSTNGRIDACLFEHDSVTGDAALSFVEGTEEYFVANCVFKTSTSEASISAANAPGLSGDTFPGYQNVKNNNIVCCTFEQTVDEQEAINAGGGGDDTYHEGNTVEACLFAVPSAYTPYVNTPNSKWTFTDAQTLVGTLDADQRIAGATAVATPDGVIYDYNGYPRGSSSLRGAAIEAPAIATPGLAVTVTAGGASVASGGSVSVGTEIAFGSSPSIQFTFTNDGSAANTVGTVSVAAGLTIDAGDNPSGATIAAGGTDTLTVNINTGTAGAFTRAVTIPTDDPDSPYTFDITGTVLDEPAPSPPSESGLGGGRSRSRSRRWMPGRTRRGN